MMRGGYSSFPPLTRPIAPHRVAKSPSKSSPSFRQLPSSLAPDRPPVTGGTPEADGDVYNHVHKSNTDLPPTDDPVHDGQANGLSATYGVEQFLNIYNANPSLPPLSYLPQPAPQPPEPIVYPAFPVADQALLETALRQTCDALDGVAAATCRLATRSLVPRLRPRCDPLAIAPTPRRFIRIFD